MGAKYFTLLTQAGEKKLAAAIAAGKALELAQMGVGDGNGTLPFPDSLQTKLVNERRRGVINALTVDQNNTNQMIAEQVIPENEGGFWLREIGLYDVDGDLIAVGNCPETYKPELKEGSGRVQTVRMVLIVSRTDAVTLKFDPTVALATRRYADTLLADHIVAANPHRQYAPLESPVFSGNPTAPTAVAGTNTTQLATTAFVADAVAYAIGVLSGKTEASTKLKLDINDIVGIPQPWPQATAPSGWLKCNGQSFDKNRYPRLAQVYPSGVLPDLRGEFIRGWDDGRGVDSGRELGTLQYDDVKEHLHHIAAKYAGGTGVTALNTAQMGFDSQTGPANGALRTFGVENLDLSPAGGNETRPRNIAFNYIVRAA
ncbi:phage tail protein [Dickeya chrysanthemi]|uniref:phage tail-collar fiber domain-containing protein n=1 Tax=Dickeya chrysanthemi TaxID=556 RepID=UPI00039D6DFD|nr:phage tail protein [Dickeya chrysanthemi]